MNSSVYFDRYGYTTRVFRCPLCDHHYDLLKARMLRQRDDTQLWHLMCTNCRHAAMFVIVFTDSGINSVGVITDLNSEEGVKFQKQEPVDTDDCLALHDIMEHHPESVLEVQ